MMGTCIRRATHCRTATGPASSSVSACRTRTEAQGGTRRMTQHITGRRRDRSAVLCAALGALVVALGSLPAGAQCAGDCGRDGRVTVSEVVTMVNIALDVTPASACVP